jgi:hypothetical protein
VRRASHAGPVLLLALGLACGAQAASTGLTISAPLPANALPVPPIPPPPQHPQHGFAPAPVPNLDLQRPLADLLAERPHMEVTPSLMEQQKDRRHGEGFVPGSAAQYDLDRRFHPSPGINIRVPMQQ